MSFRKNLLNYPMDFISNFYWRLVDNLAFSFNNIAELYYKKSIGIEYEREYKNFDISNDDKVLHIGCGSFPLTEITLAEVINANIVGIDKNARVVKIANKLIHKKNLQNKIRINHGNGIVYPVNNFNVIIVSSCASPMLLIVNHIFNHLGRNCRISVFYRCPIEKNKTEIVISK